MYFIIQVASHLKTCGKLSDSHSSRTLLMRSWGAWRKYVDFNQNKADAVFKAASFWLGRSLHVRVCMCVCLCVCVCMRVYVGENKADAVFKAVSFWLGRSLHVRV